MVWSPRVALFVAMAVAGCGAPIPPAPAVELPRALPEPPPPAVVVTSARAPPDPPAPDPQPAVVLPCTPGAPVDPANLRESLAGSFTAPGIDEMIGAMSCDPWGSEWGHVLVRRTGGAWAMVRALPPPHPRFGGYGCRKLRLAGGRDLPICSVTSVSYGETYHGLVALDYTRPEDDEVVKLVAIVDTTDTACTGETELTVGHLDGVALTDVRRDGDVAVRVTVRVAKIHVPRQPPCQNMGFAGAGQPPPNLPNPRAQIITFIARGATLTPTPAGARVLASIAAMRKP